MNKRLSFSLITHGVESCNGSCTYCSAASSMNYNMGINLSKDLEAECRRVNAKNVEEAKFDFPAVEKRMDEYFGYTKDKHDVMKGSLLHVDLWGADGLCNFDSLVEEIYFLEDYCKEREWKLDPHTSTNGLACVVKEWTDFLHEHHIHLQLSHDGLGQWIRTKTLDPMDLPEVRALIRDGTIDWINCCLSFWNWSIFDNIDYYNSKLREIFPEVWSKDEYCSQELNNIYRKLYVKLNHIYDSTYDIRAKNISGKYRTRYYDSLKDAEIGNLAFRNRPDLAEKYNIPELAHVLDEYINQWYRVYAMFSNMKDDDYSLVPYKSYLMGQLNRYHILKPNQLGQAGSCFAYQRGYKNTNFVIDTIGEYCQCNLIDSAHQVLNPKAEQADYCKDCKYKYSKECLHCGSVKPADECSYYYRWNNLLESIYYLKRNGRR